MSIDNEDRFSMDHSNETNLESQKKSKFSYTREFLLSLSGLDSCKKLPSGFDESLLREFEDASQDRQRLSGDFSTHGLRRNDYSSSPPTRGELGGYARGIHGRWESRSSGRNDRDNDSQSDRDSDTGRRYGNQSRRPWQNPEHDGLLGKGAFPRPSGYAAGTSAPRCQSNDSSQLNRSNEPYHPPRPYKALHHSRRDTKDSYNDETFGSSDSTSEDRAEEEKKRRASFELLRREHHKAFQERQNSNSDGRKDGFDFSKLLGDSEDEKVRPDGSNDADESAVLPGSNSSSLPLQSTASRPLVPPGFASTVLERKLEPKPSADNFQPEASPLHAKGCHLSSGISGVQEEKQATNKISLNEQKFEGKSLHVPATDTSGRAVNLASVLGISSDGIGTDNQLEKLSSFSRVTEAQETAETIEQAAEKLGGKKVLESSNQELVPPILDKLINGAMILNVGGSTSFIEQNDGKGEEDTWSPQTVKSSKFAHLFLEEEKKSMNDISSSRPSDLLSLIQGAHKFQNSKVQPTDQLTSGLASQSQSHGTTNSERLSNISTSKSQTGSPVLTCEDLEQSILSEVSEKDSTLPPAVQDWNISDMKTEQRETNVDAHASQHLLSLLQKGTVQEDKNTGLWLNVEISPSENPPKSEGVIKEANARNSVNSGKSLTLETLFGTAFMKELQSVGEPVSGSSDVSELVDPAASNMSGHDLSQRGQLKSNGFPEHLFGFGDHQTELEDSRIVGFGRPADAQFAEEENLLKLGNLANLQKFPPFRGSPKQEPEAPFDITEKLAALSSVMGNERPTIGGQDRHFLYHSQNSSEPRIPIQHSNAHPPHQLSNSGPVFHPFDSSHANGNPRINFMPPGNMFQPDLVQNHQYPPNMVRPPFHLPGGGMPEFEPVRRPMLQEMHVQGNLAPHHLLQRLPSGAQHHPHLSNQLPGLVPEMNSTQDFPFGHWQPNHTGDGMLPVSDASGSEHLASLQRLLGMEPKQMPHLGPTGPHRQGSYGHELDLGFHLR